LVDLNQSGAILGVYRYLIDEVHADRSDRRVRTSAKQDNKHSEARSGALGRGVGGRKMSTTDVLPGVVVIFILFAVLLLLGAKSNPNRYGNFAQVTQSLAAIVFGAASLWVAHSVFELQQSVFELQQNASADAALGRAATLIERVHEDTARQQRYLETDDATAGTRAYDCIIYLKYRVAYTPQWTAAKLNDAPYVMSPVEIGKEPKLDELPENQRAHWEEISTQFNKCIGRNSPEEEDDSDKAQEGGSDKIPKKLNATQIRKRGEKIRRLISYPLAREELALLEWPHLSTLPDSSPARKLIKDEVISDLCASRKFKPDVFDLFSTLRDAAKDTKNEASGFADLFLKSYPNLDTFLKDVCDPLFKKMG
jgi:hypothetical protein